MKTREEILTEKNASFNPNENGLRDHGIFGLPYNEEEAKIVLLPIPWEGTVSYKNGTALAPEAILEASQQIDLADPENLNLWQQGIAYATNSWPIFKKSKKTKNKFQKYLKQYSNNYINKSLQNKINTKYEKLNKYIEEKTTSLLEKNKFVGVVGGEHGVILGYLQALAKKHDSFGILQIDAHADLRENYEGLKYSHASIFNNILKIKNIKSLVQIGIRDLCPAEVELIEKEKNRIKTFYNSTINDKLFQGDSWAKIVTEIINELPDKIYISFDIDALDPTLCPNTGTPVPGGFSFDQIVFLLKKIGESNKEIIGFDLVEVAPGQDEWDANVGARILYQLCLTALKNQK